MTTKLKSYPWNELYSKLREEVAVVGADRVVLYVNQPMLDRLGTSLSHVEGRSCCYLFQGYPSSCQRVGEECAVNRVLKTGQPASAVCRQSPRARHRHYLKLDAFPMRGPEGKMEAVICLPRELGLLERYKCILNTMREGVAVVSREGRLIEVNSALCLMLGFSEKELATLRLTDFVGEVHEPPLHVALASRDGGNNGGPPIELDLTRKDGSKLTAEVAARPLLHDLEDLYIVFVRDVTVKRQRDESVAEQAEEVIKSAAEYRAIFEGSNEALIVIEDDTTVAMVNRRFEEMTGYRWHEIEGKMSFLPLVAEEDREQVLAKHRLRRETSQATQPHHKAWMVTKGGRKWLGEVSGAMISGTRRSLVAIRDITESQRLQQELERRNRELEVLYRIAALLSRSTDLTSMLNLALEMVVDMTGKSRGAIHLMDEEQQTLLIRACVGHETEYAQVIDRLKIGEGFGGRVARTGQPLFVRDISLDPRLTRRAVLGDGLRALASVPIVSSGKVLGVMSISTAEAREFSPEEQHLLISIGNEIGTVVERTQHLERARDRAREASSLMLISQEIASTLDLQRILDRTLAVMCMQVWADRGGIALLSQTGDELVSKSLWGEEAVSLKKVWKIGEGVAGWVALHQIPFLSDDVATDPRIHSSIAPDLGYHGMIGVPLKTAGKLLGVVTMASKRAGAFTKPHLRLLSAYAAQASLALENALLYERVKNEASSLTEALTRLAASEHRFRALIEHSSDSTLVLTAGGKITYASPSTTRISGFAVGELVGLRAFDLIDPEDRDQSEQLFAEIVRDTGCIRTAEFRARNKEGRRAWIELTASNLLEEPSVQGVVINWRDISRRKRVERDRERLIAVLEATPDTVVICEPDGRLLYANKAGRLAMKLEEDADLSGLSVVDLVQDQNKARLSNEILPATVRDGSWVGEITSTGSGGNETASLIVAQAHKAPDGAVQFMSAIARDITELRRVVRALETAAEEWRTTFDGITEGILVLDSERRVLRCNLAMAEFLGLPFHEILGRHCCNLLCGAAEGDDNCTALRALQTKCKENSILQLGDRWFAITVYPLESHGHTLSGMVHIMSDITERKKAEEALRESEKKIRGLAEASVRAQEEERHWVAGEVHDRIAQTLVAVHQQLQALDSATQSDPSAQRLVNRALELQHQAIHETRNIMSDLYLPTLDQYGLVTVMEEELNHFQKDTGCETRIDADYPERPPRHVEGVLYRIFHEALVNVKKHGAGTGRVAVSVRQEDGNVGIVVRDDGPGFDVAQATQSRRYGGLVSMRRRAEIIGGTFQVESSPGQGTTVSFSVPAQLGESLAPNVNMG